MPVFIGSRTDMSTKKLFFVYLYDGSERLRSAVAALLLLSLHCVCANTIKQSVGYHLLFVWCVELLCKRVHRRWCEWDRFLRAMMMAAETSSVAKTTTPTTISAVIVTNARSVNIHHVKCLNKRASTSYRQYVYLRRKAKVRLVSLKVMGVKGHVMLDGQQSLIAREPLKRSEQKLTRIPSPPGEGITIEGPPSKIILFVIKSLMECNYYSSCISTILSVFRPIYFFNMNIVHENTQKEQEIKNKKLIRRWDSERELSLRRHCTRTKNAIDSYINSATDRFLQRRFTKFSEITQCNGHYAVQGHSRSPMLVPVESLYTTSY